MSTTLREFESKFRVEELLVHRSKYWSWSMRPVHTTLGSGILSLNRYCTSFADLNDHESKDLGDIVRLLDKRLHDAFKPDKMNYIMLMMVDLHLHFHVLPRYSEPREFGGLSWIDSGWPKPPAMGDNEDRSTNPVLLDIKNALRR